MSTSSADKILEREQCSDPCALTNTDELIINRGRVPWWTIAADEARDYRVMVMEQTNGDSSPGESK